MQEGVFYLPNSSPVSIRKDINRTIDEIPLNELKKVIENHSNGSNESNEEVVFRSVLEFYGFNRLTTVAYDRLKKAQSYKPL